MRKTFEEALADLIAEYKDEDNDALIAALDEAIFGLETVFLLGDDE